MALKAGGLTESLESLEVKDLMYLVETVVERRTRIPKGIEISFQSAIFGRSGFMKLWYPKSEAVSLQV